MKKVFSDKGKSKPLRGVIAGIIIILTIIVIGELPRYIKTKIESVPVMNEPVTPAHSRRISIASIEPYRFDPYTKGNSSTTPQFVILSFDGSKSIDMWKETLDFARKMNAEAKPIHFTYFISSVYFLAQENKDKYTPPYGNTGDSAIGYSEDLLSINERVRSVNEALEDGHEIASHASGHWSGVNWSVSDWAKEIGSFDGLVFDFKQNNPQIKFTDDLHITKEQVRGFRAPELGINSNLYTALSKFGYYYDSSEVSYHDEWPRIDSGGVWHIPISSVYFKDMNMNIIAVDYSIWVHQTGGQSILKKDTAEWQMKLKDLADGYYNHYLNNYYSNRAPIVIDNHFSQWNDGLYWEAMKIFAERVCGQTDVRCSTFSELVDYMEKR